MDEDIQYEEAERSCEFAFLVQRFLSKGWKLLDIEYGERKFGFRPRLKASRNNGPVQLFSPEDICDWANKDEMANPVTMGRNQGS